MHIYIYKHDKNMILEAVRTEISKNSERNSWLRVTLDVQSYDHAT